jgi:small subunit ribosomal protein S20
LEEIKLANTASAIKRVRSNARKAAYNKIIRNRTRTLVRTARASLEGQDAAASPAAIMEAVSALDRAASKGVIHKNNAARRKGRLMKRLAAMKKSS